MSLLEHLDELRSRLFKAALSFVLAFGACSAFSKPILRLLLAPVQDQLPAGESLAFIRLTEPLMVYLKASAVVALFVAAPFVLYQFWEFVSPGLYGHERRWVLPFLLFGSAFFVGGGVFSYLMVVPVAAAWLVNLGGGFQNTITIDEAFGFVSRLVIGMGVVFELPILIFFLARVGLVTPAFLMRHLRIVIVVISVVSAILTPPDPLSMILMAAPMIGLYLLGVGIAWMSVRKRT